MPADAPVPALMSPPRRTRRLRRLLAYAIGLALFAAAIWAVLSRADAFDHALAAAGNASPWLILAIVALPLANIFAVSASFWVLTIRHGRVGLGEMYALILSSWLLNHLPFRPGMFGRVAYHRAINGIPVRASIRVLLEQLVCGVAALVVMLALAALLASRGGPVLFSALLALALALAIGGLLLGARPRAGATASPAPAAYAAAVGFRLLDFTIWIARYLLLFRLIGQPIRLADAAGITAGAQAAMLSPIPLGVREWTVGLVHAVLQPSSTDPAAPALTLDALAPGVAADLANRGFELLVAVPLGALASVWLWRRARLATPRATPRATHPLAPPSV